RGLGDVYKRQLQEEKSDPAIVLCAAYLHDLGSKETEQKDPDIADASQEKEGTIIAQTILTNLGADSELIDEVCEIISHHHHPRNEETINFKIVFDADQMVILEEKLGNATLGNKGLAEKINQTFLTETGKKLAKKILLDRELILKIKGAI
ncbi:MAG: HD domain-containing protein, partial [Desulfobacterota bacterium]|nr:HD domain-containing protein [Thermodesulfobacteriota bacterium]